VGNTKTGRVIGCLVFVAITAGFWWGNLRERNYLGDPGVDKKTTLRWIFKKWDLHVWIGSSWLRIGTDGQHL